MDERCSDIEDRFSTMEERFSGVENKLIALDKKIDDITAEMHSHFDATAERFDKKFDLLAQSVAALGEKIERRTSEIAERLERGFAETWAMLKFSSTRPDLRDSPLTPPTSR